jgi:DNA-binding transcriptional ArsR family regulator
MTDLKTRNREALTALREQRAAETEAAQARLKEEVKIEREITRVLKEGPKTVPALAEATGLSTRAVFWHLIALRKYGKVAEAEQEGDYFQYRLVGET